MKTYKDVEGYFSFEPFYNYIGDNFLKNGMNIIEIGAFLGKSSIFMADKIKSKGLQVNFIVIDHWRGSEEHVNNNNDFYHSEIAKQRNYLFHNFINNVNKCGVNDYITPFRCESSKAAIMFKDNYFDFVFIDASHDYANVKSDIEAWMPKVKPGGILGGDDYHDSWKGVLKAVDEKIKNQERNFLPAWYTKIPEIT